MARLRERYSGWYIRGGIRDFGDTVSVLFFIERIAAEEAVRTSLAPLTDPVRAVAEIEEIGPRYREPSDGDLFIGWSIRDDRRFWTRNHLLSLWKNKAVATRSVRENGGAARPVKVSIHIGEET